MQSFASQSLCAFLVSFVIFVIGFDCCRSGKLGIIVTTDGMLLADHRAETSLIRPPAPGRARTGEPPSPSGTPVRGPARWAARPRQDSPRAGLWRSRDYGAIWDRQWVKCPAIFLIKSLCASSVNSVSSAVGFVRRHLGRQLLIVTVYLGAGM